MRRAFYVQCNDVVEGLGILDQFNNMPNFVCSTDGIGRLPKFIPEDLNVLSEISNSRIRDIERKMHLMETSMARVNSTCDETDTRVNTLEVSVKTYNRLVRQLKTSGVVLDIVAVKSKSESNKKKIKKKKKNGDATSDTTEPLATMSQKKSEEEHVTDMLRRRQRTVCPSLRIPKESFNFPDRRSVET